MDYQHRHDESIIFRSSRKPLDQHDPSDHKVHHIRIRYITDSGERRVREYSIWAFSPDAARRKAGDLFRREYPFLRKQ